MKLYYHGKDDPVCIIETTDGFVSKYWGRCNEDSNEWETIIHDVSAKLKIKEFTIDGKAPVFKVSKKKAEEILFLEMI